MDLRKPAAALLLVLAGIGLSAQSAVAAPVSGTFQAGKACPAYVSKNSKSNPDDAAVAAGRSYRVLEVNDPQHPAWYRMGIAGATPANRWVAAECGEFKAQHDSQSGAGAATQGGGALCHTAGQQQSYVLSLSWQSAFCASRGEKPECAAQKPGDYSATHFSLHGLWPNLNACGINYGFCGSERTQYKVFCDYPQVQMVADVRDALGRVMPGTRSCLERHEWFKHGTCQSGTPDQYFSQAIELVRQFNESPAARYIADHLGQEVDTSDLLAQIDASFGAGASHRFQLSCNRDGDLVEIDINLPAGIGAGARLSDLIQAGPQTRGTGKCGKSFGVARVTTL